MMASTVRLVFPTLSIYPHTADQIPWLARLQLTNQRTSHSTSAHPEIKWRSLKLSSDAQLQFPNLQKNRLKLNWQLRNPLRKLAKSPSKLTVFNASTPTKRPNTTHNLKQALKSNFTQKQQRKQVNQ